MKTYYTEATIIKELEIFCPFKLTPNSIYTYKIIKQIRNWYKCNQYKRNGLINKSKTCQYIILKENNTVYITEKSKIINMNLKSKFNKNSTKKTA